MGVQAILYICHGSRVKEGIIQATGFINKAKKKMDCPIQEICFLELAEPTIEEGIKRCIHQGATKIAVVPILLLTATHAKEDIPGEIEKAMNKYPDVQFSYGRPFGVHSKIIDVLMERVKSQKAKIDDDAMVLLVGRGSSDPDVRRDLNKIANALYGKFPFQKVETCFLAAAEPTFEQGLKRAQETGHRQVFVLPYLLFTGILMKSIEKKLKKLSTPEQEFILCDYLGYHPHLQEVLYERVRELIQDAVTENDTREALCVI
ncbi:sirohydrochlorin chelatase [Fictibacillus gelatini]|uniref:sirohydrochlorin chelatase n=1 Tax=Fictibacillus gelatini TaxID=225985 RepID=UPI0004280407|nr:sirohydrochlorin chelatase [Fictibacillus gelatini]